MTLSQFAPTTSQTMNVLIATQQGLEDAYVVAQQAINYPPGRRPRRDATPKAAAKSTVLEPRLGQNPRVSPSQKLHLIKGANVAWAEGIDQGTTVTMEELDEDAALLTEVGYSACSFHVFPPNFSQRCCRIISSFTRVFGACSYPRFRCSTLPFRLDLVVRRGR